MNDREDRGVRADPQRQRQRGRDRERRRAEQGAHAEAHVVDEIRQQLRALGPHVSPSIVVDENIAHRVELAETLLGFAARVVGRHPERDVALGAHVEVERQLVVDVDARVRPAKAEIAAPARRASGVATHVTAGSVRSTRVTACE